MCVSGAGLSGAIQVGVGKVQQKVSDMWQSWKDKDPDSLLHKTYQAGTKVIENMTAEERLMRNIPKDATKVRHPLLSYLGAGGEGGSMRSASVPCCRAHCWPPS